MGKEINSMSNYIYFVKRGNRLKQATKEEWEKDWLRWYLSGK